MTTKNLNKTTRSFFIVFLLVLVQLSCTEDRIDPEITGHIKGYIKDTETNNPVVNVEISTNPATQVLLTNENGEFVLKDIEIGEYKILINKDQYENKMLNAKVKEDDTTFVNVMLKKKESATSTNPPSFTDNFSPANGATNISTSVDLSWQLSNTENTDSIKFDILLYRSNSQSHSKIATNVGDTAFQVEGLNYNTVYYWQIIAKNKEGDTTHSEIQNFRTIPIPETAFFYSKKVDGNYEIMGYNIESGSSARLTYNSYRDWAPKLNRTNNKIAFTSDSLVKNHIYIMAKDGQNIQKVSDISVDGYNNYGNAFCWDDATGNIFFSHYSYLYRVNQDGTGLTNIATAPAGRHFREVDVSPNGEKIIAITIGEESYTSEIYIMDIDGSDMTEVIGDMDGTIEAPSFSIDGKSILFTRDISGHEAIDGRQLNSHIFSYNFDTQDTTDLSANKPLGFNDLHPRYSNTGDKIVFVNVRNDNSTPPEIWMMNIDGTNREELISNATLPYW
jgi:TolB protein